MIDNLEISGFPPISIMNLTFTFGEIQLINDNMELFRFKKANKYTKKTGYSIQSSMQICRKNDMTEEDS